MKRLMWVQSALLLAVTAGLVWTGARLSALEGRLAALEQAPAPQAAVSAPTVRRGARAHRPEATIAAAPAIQAVAPAIEDHLWSDDGRAAIDDVVAEREERERERWRERWQQMMQHQTDKALSQVASELALDEATTGELRDLVTAWMEDRSARWRQMKEDDVDFVALQEQAESARERFEQDVTALIGEDGLEALESALESGRRF